MLILNEIKYAIRQPALIFTAVLALLFITVIGSAATSRSDFFQSLSLVQMLVLPFLVSIVGANIFLRDSISNMSELIDCTPQTNRSKQLWRLASHLIVTSFPFFISFLLIGVILVSDSVDVGIQDLTFGFFLLIIPNLFFISALVVFVARYTSNHFSIYMFSALFGGGYILLGSITGFPFLAGSSVANDSLYSLMLWLDPLGITPLLHGQSMEHTLWSQALLFNRLLSSILSLVIIIFSLKISPKTRSETKKTSDKDIITNNRSLVKNRFTEMVRITVNSTLKTKTTLLLILLWAGITFNEVISGLYSLRQSGAYDLNSIDAIHFVTNDLLLVFGSICVAMWSWLVCWNEKRQDFSEIIATTPVSNALRLLTQFVSLFILVFALVVIAALSSLSVELLLNTDIILTQYIMQFAISSLPLLLLSMYFVCIHNIVSTPAKGGMIVSAILLIKFTPITSSLGMTSLLWSFASSPLQQANHYWGLDGSISVLLPFLLLWLLVGVILFSFAETRSHRGTGLSTANSWIKSKVSYSLVLICLFAAFTINNQLTDEKPLTYEAQQVNWQVNYEKKYSSWKNQYQPQITHVESVVQLYPHKGTATVDLKYTLQNQHQGPISEVLIGRYGNYTNWKVKQSVKFKLIEDPCLQQKIIRFKQPIQPNEKVVVSLALTYTQPMLWPANSNVVVKQKFTNILTEKFLPQIGYQSSFESDDKKIRSQNNLNADASKKQKLPMVTYSTVISTKEGYVAASQGDLKNQWQNNGRVFFQYESVKAAAFKFVWASVPNENYHKSSKTNSIELYAPTNQSTSQTIIDIVSDILTFVPTSLGVQPPEKLRILAAPDLPSLSYVAPDLIVLDFDRILRNISFSNENLDLLYKKIVEPIVEHALLNNKVKNAPHLTELIKGFILLDILEKKQGVDAQQRFLDASNRAHKLLDISNAEQPIAYFDESDPQKMSLRALAILRKLEQVLGKSALKNALTDYISKPEKQNQVDFIQLLKQGLESQKSKQVENIFEAQVGVSS